MGISTQCCSRVQLDIEQSLEFCCSSLLDPPRARDGGQAPVEKLEIDSTRQLQVNYIVDQGSGGSTYIGQPRKPKSITKRTSILKDVASPAKPVSSPRTAPKVPSGGATSEEKYQKIIRFKDYQKLRSIKDIHEHYHIG